MRPSLIILFSFVLFKYNYCQDSIAKFSLGAQAGVYWSDLMLKANGELEFLKTQFDSLEHGRIMSSAGLVMKYHINSKITIGSGINLKTLGFGIDTLENAGIADIRFNFQYVEVPLNLEYTFKESKTWKPILRVGLSYQYLVGMQRRYFEFGQTNETLLKETKQYVTSAIGINVGIGVNKKVYEKTNLQIVISGERNLSSISDSPLERYWQNAGIYFALTRDIDVRKK